MGCFLFFYSNYTFIVHCFFVFVFGCFFVLLLCLELTSISLKCMFIISFDNFYETIIFSAKTQWQISSWSMEKKDTNIWKKVWNTKLSTNVICIHRHSVLLFNLCDKSLVKCQNCSFRSPKLYGKCIFCSKVCCWMFCK